MLISEGNMEHELKLQPRYYEYILGGTKDIEIRLYDEKRQKINIGDTIIFKKEPELNESFKVKVVGLLRYEILMVYLMILQLIDLQINLWKNQNY